MTRTTKRFLSIVLTAMMLFTFIPTSALAVLEDVDDIDYNETVEVLVALGAIDGAQYNAIAPEGTISRGEAAAIIFKLVDGEVTVQITEGYMYQLKNEEIYYLGTGYRDRDWLFEIEVAGTYRTELSYAGGKVNFDLNVSEGSSASSEQTMYTVAVAGTTVNAKKVAPGTEVELIDFSDAVAAVTPAGDSVQGLYFDAGFTQLVPAKFVVTDNTTLYPKFPLASNKTELILNANGEAEALQVTGPTGTITTYTASGTQVDVSPQDQAKLVTMAQANTGKANNTVYMFTTPAQKEKVVPVVGGAMRYDAAPEVWYEGYVEYAASLGLVTGRGDGVFDPKGDVTGIEFAKMMLVALGYDANREYTGDDWKLEAASKANSVGLYGDLVLSMNEGLSREDIAQMIFNTLTEEKITFSFDASTARDMAAAGADLTVVTGSGTAIIDNENLKKVGEAVKYTTANGEQYVDKKVQFAISDKAVTITKDGEPATAVKAAYTAFSDIGYVGTVDNTVYTTVITDAIVWNR